MTKRLQTIFNEIPSCQVFADIGCDHGYIAKAMIECNKCQKFIIADISESCLEKARGLLKKHLESGKGESVVSDGFEKIDYCDVALIAGMGGEEIIKILDKASSLPNTLILQPMKNVDKVRERLVALGYKINKDYVFFACNKYYDLIVCEKGEDKLTEEEILFGRTNVQLKGKDFCDRILVQINKLNGYLQKKDLAQDSRQKILEQLESLKRYV